MTTPLQQSFAAGEIAPQLQVRSSVPGHQAGTIALKNFFADPRGPAIRRFGFRFLLNEGEPLPPDDPSLVCAEVTGFNDTFAAANADLYLGYSPFKDRFIYVQNRVNFVGEQQVAFMLNPQTDLVTKHIDLGSNADNAISALLISDDGDTQGKQNLCLATLQGGNFRIRRYRIEDVGFTGTGDLQASASQAAVPAAERLNDVLILQLPNSAWLAIKDGWTRTNLTNPANYQVNTQVGAAAPDANTYLMLLESTVDGSFHYAQLTSGLTIPTPTVAQRTDVNPQTDIQPIVIGSSVYWAVNRLEDVNTTGYILKTAPDGTEQSFIDCTFGLNQAWSIQSGDSRFFYSANNNSLYWLQSNFIYRMDIATEVVEKCQLNLIIDPDTGNPYPGQNYGGLLGIYDNGFTAYLHSFEAVATTIQLFARSILRL